MEVDILLEQLESSSLSNLTTILTILQNLRPKTNHFKNIFPLLENYQIMSDYEELSTLKYIKTDLQEIHLEFLLEMGKIFQNLFLKLKHTEWVAILKNLSETSDLSKELLVELLHVEEVSRDELGV
jgi:hypothetical protein